MIDLSKNLSRKTLDVLAKAINLSNVYFIMNVPPEKVVDVMWQLKPVLSGCNVELSPRSTLDYTLFITKKPGVQYA